MIPVAILIGLLPGGNLTGYGGGGAYAGAITIGSIVFVPIVLMLLIKKKYPRRGTTGTSNCCASATASASTYC